MKFQMNAIQSNVEFILEFENFSNLTIICSDGLLHSHKVVIASISSYIKQLLGEFPLGDEVTLYLPDFTQARVERFVNSRVFEDDLYEEELSMHFKANRPLKSFLQSEIEIKAESEEEEEDLKCLEESKDQLPNNVQIVQEKNKEQIADDEKEFELQENFEEEGVLTKEERDDPQDLTPDQLSRLRVKNKKIAYEKAVQEFVSGRATSYRQAAIKFGVSDVTVRRMILQSREFSGQGKGYPFTSKEQKSLRDRILLATNNGKDLTFRSIQDLISQEASNIISQYPERSKALSKFIDPTHDKAYYFARKQGLDKIIKENERRILKIKMQ